MGHVQPGGEAAGSPTPLGEHPVWPLWRGYKRLFPTWTLPLSTWSTPGSWGWLGNDLLSGLRKNPSTRKAFALLAETPNDVFNGLSALAAMNLRRQEQGFQLLLAVYITIPVTLLIALGEIDGERFWRLVQADEGMIVRLGFFLIALTLFYLAALWRARQMVHVLDLIRIERGLDPVSTVELRDQG